MASINPENEIHSTIGLLRIARAGSEDAHVLSEILRDAALWLKANGIDQWQGILKEGFETFVSKRITEEEVYLAFLKDVPVGTFRIIWEDPIFWGERGKDGLAGYVHGLAVKRKHSGHEVGKQLLAKAIEFIQARGKSVRLDCVANNPRLCRYYEDFGFEYAGDSVPSEHSRTRLYELKERQVIEDER